MTRNEGTPLVLPGGLAVSAHARARASLTKESGPEKRDTRRRARASAMQALGDFRAALVEGLDGVRGELARVEDKDPAAAEVMYRQLTEMMLANAAKIGNWKPAAPEEVPGK